MSTNEELVLRAEQAAQQTAKDKADIQELVTKLEEVQAPSIAASKEDIRQAIIEKGVECGEDIAFSEYGNKVRAIDNGGDDSLRTILYMPLNGNLDIYGECKYSLALGKCDSEYGETGLDWTAEFGEGVFDGERALAFLPVETDEEGYPMEEPYYKYITYPVGPAIMTGDFTVDCWYFAQSGSGIWENAAFKLGGYSAFGCLISYSGIYSFMFNGGDIKRYTHPNGTDNAWHHIAMTRNGDTIYCFIDGEIVATTTTNVSSVSPAYNKEMGKTGFFNGIPVFRFAHLRILNHALWTENFTPPTKESYTQYAK